MITIKTYCPACGEISLKPDDIELRVDDAIAPGADSFYGFTCPDCFAPVRKRADQRVVRLLETAGVSLLKLQSKGLNPEKSTIAADESIDFYDTLHDEDRFRSWILQLRKLVLEDRDSGW